MFNPIDGGTVEEIQGLPCWVPRPGYIWNPVRRAWVHVGIYKRDPKNARGCYWEPDKRWAKIANWKAEEDAKNRERNREIKKSGSSPIPEWRHPELDEFIDECWMYRRGGFWFSNKGEPTYITGKYWYYLSCFSLETRNLPDYVDLHRKFYYAWQYVLEDPKCYGLNLVAKRRQGKSYMGAAIGLESCTDARNYHFGIQSKTFEDAKMLFNKHLVTPFRSLPFFFRPECYLPAGRTPASVLRFETGKFDTNADNELQSFIDFGSSQEYFYDGHKLQFFWGDEAGKTMEANVFERWGIVKKCLRNHKNEIIGKALHTSTVGEMESGGGNFLKLWVRSNQLDRNELGVTESGLYNFFMPADETYAPDIYGFADVETGRRVITITRESITDQRELAREKRQDPLDEKEAFSIDASTCVFASVDKMNSRYDLLKYLPRPLYQIGNFNWKDGIRDNPAGVDFDLGPNGRYMVAYLPPPEFQNRMKVIGGVRHPDNTEMFGAGGDPYDHKHLTKNSLPTMSMGAGAIIKRPHPLAPSQIDNSCAMLYASRPDDPDIYYEDLLKACVFYGCKILLEDNKSNCLDYFEKRGYGEYLVWLPGSSKPGIHNGAQTAGGGTNQMIAEVTDQNITHHIDACVFPQLIDDWLKFNPAKTTEFDMAMAYGFALINVKMQSSLTPTRKDTKQTDIADLGFRFKRHQRYRQIYHNR